MTRGQLLRRNLTWFWRTNLAVVAGVAVAAAVLAGALLVGDSVRASLRDLVLLRLGATSYVITSENFFREQLAADLAAQPEFTQAFSDAVPLIALDAVVTHESSRRRASNVLVYGVDERFWQFHGASGVTPPEQRDALVSTALAEEFGAAAGDSVVIRVQRPADVPVDSLHADKEDLGRTLRLRVREALPAAALGEFAVRPQQGAVRAIFVSLQRLQRDLDQPGMVNGVLVSEAENNRASGAEAEARRAKLATLLRGAYQLEDIGLQVKGPLPPGTFPGRSRQPMLSVESDRVIVDDAVAQAALVTAKSLELPASSVFAYLANTIRIGEREIPYSLVAAVDGDLYASLPGAAETASTAGSAHPPLWLNDWAWRDMGARPGDVATIEYYVWEDGGRLTTRAAQFTVRGRVPMDGLGGDRTLAPTFPGISESPSLSNWDPPFPVDLKRIRPRDEDYWDKSRTAPKGFISLATGQQLWQTRYGKLTAVQVAPPTASVADTVPQFVEKLREQIDPVAAGIAVYAARAEGTQASAGAINFGEYFVYFSFFLVVSAVLLTSLFFRLGIEQRLKEIGLLEAFGYSPAEVRRLFLTEGAILAVAGSVFGAAGGVGYAALMMHGLRTWWVGAVGTTYLRLDVQPISLIAGVGGGIAAALICIALTLRGLRAFTPRALVTGSREAAVHTPAERRRAWLWGAVAAVLAVALLGAAAAGALDQAIGFFSAGSLILAALLLFQWAWLVSRKRQTLAAAGAGVPRLGVRNASWRPGRSLLCVALMASATFILVAVDSFRRDVRADALDPRSGTGGFPLLAESLLPIPYDLNTSAGREALNLTDASLEGARFYSFRLRPGEDASCLNLYQPRNPRVLGVPAALAESGRFAFQSSQAETEAQRGNPWLLLDVEFPDGAIPAIADANTMTYILQRKLGEDVVIEHAGREVRLRLVAALASSIFQSELLISEKNFLRAFPSEGGYRFFLLETPAGKSGDVAAALEDTLEDYGFDVMDAGEKLATFYRVENTYISTFQALGGLGLLLGTLGLAAVMLRNVLERRRELALLRAVGYRPRDLATLTLAENMLLLFGGLVTGILSAALAILPALAERGGAPGGGSLGVILAAVLLTGFLASLAAVAAVLRAPLLESLRSE
ncbi:MAG TPA: ABC transporter permease [Candidatus Acidoferrales bacterium]